LERVPNEGLIKGLILRLESFARALENASIAEYIEMFKHPRRLYFINFLSGIYRGFGMAIGFSIVGALFIGLILRLAQLNLPIIGEFIGSIARIVEHKLKQP
jgi:hypothetical protein